MQILKPKQFSPWYLKTLAGFLTNDRTILFQINCVQLFDEIVGNSMNIVCAAYVLKMLFTGMFVELAVPRCSASMS